MRAIMVALLLSGCALTPSEQRHACELLDIAQSEAPMAPAWHSEAGQVLHACGVPRALWKAEMQSCYAEAMDGWRKHEECVAIQMNRPRLTESPQ